MNEKYPLFWLLFPKKQALIIKQVATLQITIIHGRNTEYVSV
jgi:hypothetical protein